MEIVKVIESTIAEMAAGEGYDREIELCMSQACWQKVTIKIISGEKPHRMVSWSPCMLYFLPNNTISVQVALQDVIITKTKINLHDPSSVDDLYNAVKPYLNGIRIDRKSPV